MQLDQTFFQKAMIRTMHSLNPIKNTQKLREKNRLCSGQTLLCRSLSLKVSDWDQKQFDENHFYLADVGYQPPKNNSNHTTRNSERKR